MLAMAFSNPGEPSKLEIMLSHPELWSAIILAFCEVSAAGDNDGDMHEFVIEQSRFHFRRCGLSPPVMIERDFSVAAAKRAVLESELAADSERLHSVLLQRVVCRMSIFVQVRHGPDKINSDFGIENRFMTLELAEDF